jgi:hypothetical protein
MLALSKFEQRREPDSYGHYTLSLRLVEPTYGDDFSQGVPRLSWMHAMCTDQHGNETRDEGLMHTKAGIHWLRP